MATMSYRRSWQKNGLKPRNGVESSTGLQERDAKTIFYRARDASPRGQRSSRGTPRVAERDTNQLRTTG